MKKSVYGVIGNPVFHSLSPIIHNTLYDIYNIEAVYLPIKIENINNLKTIAKSLDISGLNVTMPHKQSIIDKLQYIDNTSELMQSVNTVKIADGNYHGYTTDGLGFLSSLEEHDFFIKDKKVLLIGAGGASKSIAYSCANANCNEIRIANRNLDNANQLKKSIQKIGFENIYIDSLQNCQPENYNLIINTTPLGMNGFGHDFSDFNFLNNAKKDTIIYDIVYNPMQTNLLKHAKSLDLQTINGLDMLIWQAFHSFHIFFDILPNSNDKQKIMKAMNF